jgi:hypothetical protein
MSDNMAFELITPNLKYLTISPCSGLLHMKTLKVALSKLTALEDITLTGLFELEPLVDFLKVHPSSIKAM